MVWFFVTLIGLVAALAALWFWGRSDGGTPDDMPPIVPSGRDVHRARAWEILNNKGNGSGDAGSI